MEKISTPVKELKLLEQCFFGTGIMNASNQHSTQCVRVKYEVKKNPSLYSLLNQAESNNFITTDRGTAESEL